MRDGQLIASAAFDPATLIEIGTALRPITIAMTFG